jgi:hypothetical protein
VRLIVGTFRLSSRLPLLFLLLSFAHRSEEVRLGGGYKGDTNY